MPGSDVVRRHLEAAKVELIQQRDDLDVEIKELDNMLSRYGITVSTETTSTSVLRPTRDGGGSQVDAAILELLAAHPGSSLRTSLVVETLKPNGWASATVRKNLSSLATKGKVLRTGHGAYAALPQTPEDTAVTVPSGPVPTTRTGGDADAQPAGGDDYGQADEDRDRDHHRGAPLTPPIDF